MSLLSEIVWDEAEYSLKKLAKLGSSNLPLIIRLTEGYEGVDEYLVYSCDDIYFVIKIEVQNMIVLKDTKGRYLSIPTDSNIRFYHQDKGEAIFKTIDLLSFPRGSVVRLVQQEEGIIEFVDVKSKRAESILVSDKLGLLVIVEVYKNRLLHCHSIVQDMLDATVHRMPLYMPFNVVVANDVTPASKITFRQLMAELKSMERSLNKKHEPFMKINIFDKLPSAKDDYEFICPEKVCYVNTILLKSISDSRMNIDEDGYQSVQTIKPLIRSPKSPAPPPMRTSPLEVGSKQSKRQPINLPTHLPRSEPQTRNDSNKDDRPKIEKKILPFSSSAPVAAVRPNVHELRNSNIYLKPSISPQDPSGSASPNHMMFSSQLINELREKNMSKSKAQAVPEKSGAKTLAVQPIIQKNATQESGASRIENKSSTGKQTDDKPETPNQKSLSKAPIIERKFLNKNQPVDKPSSPYDKRASSLNLIEKKVEKVEISAEDNNSDYEDVWSPNSPTAATAHSPSSEWKMLGDVPKSISSMSVSDVGRILRLMKVDETKRKKFADHCVDGSLLVSLDAPTLASSFNLDKLETIKLLKFVHEGWRPLRER